jgi:hypothetical protein
LTRNDPAPVRCRFDDRVKVAKKAGEEIINQFHPLVRFVVQHAELSGAIRYPAIAARMSRTNLPISVAAGDYWVAVTRWTFEALRVSEQLWFAVKYAHSDTTLSDEDAERFVMAVAESGDDWNVSADDVDMSAAAATIEHELLVRAWDAFQAHESTVKAQNEDRADAQMRSLDTHLTHQRAKYEELRSRHLARGNPGLARAQEVNLERLVARIQRERLAIDTKRHVHSRMNEICVGVVRVH